MPITDALRKKFNVSGGSTIEEVINNMEVSGSGSGSGSIQLVANIIVTTSFSKTIAANSIDSIMGGNYWNEADSEYPMTSFPDFDFAIVNSAGLQNINLPLIKFNLGSAPNASNPISLIIRVRNDSSSNVVVGEDTEIGMVSLYKLSEPTK